jgi:hypothetical protein
MFATMSNLYSLVRRLVLVKYVEVPLSVWNFYLKDNFRETNYLPKSRDTCYGLELSQRQYGGVKSAKAISRDDKVSPYHHSHHNALSLISTSWSTIIPRIHRNHQMSLKFTDSEYNVEFGHLQAGV